MNEIELLKRIEELEEKLKAQDRNLVKLTEAIPKVIKNVCLNILLDKGLLIKNKNKDE